MSDNSGGAQHGERARSGQEGFGGLDVRNASTRFTQNGHASLSDAWPSQTVSEIDDWPGGQSSSRRRTHCFLVQYATMALERGVVLRFTLELATL